MDLVVNEDLRAYIDPLTDDEHQALERSLLAEGCRDALVLWGDVLVDGHNRYGICRKHNLPFQTVRNPRFQSIEDVHLWMIDQHLGRRSVSDFQRGVLALRKREILSERQARVEPAATDDGSGRAEAVPSAEPGTASADAATAAGREAFETREALARAARLSSSQFQLIEKIQRQAAPEVVAAVKAGTISINAAAAVSSLPPEEQVAAANAGRDELKLAARRVRESKRKPAPAETTSSSMRRDDSSVAAVPVHPPEAEDSIALLRERIASLSAENTALRREVAQLEDRLRQALVS